MGVRGIFPCLGYDGLVEILRGLCGLGAYVECGGSRDCRQGAEMSHRVDVFLAAHWGNAAKRYDIVLYSNVCTGLAVQIFRIAAKTQESGSVLTFRLGKCYIIYVIKT